MKNAIEKAIEGGWIPKNSSGEGFMFTSGDGSEVLLSPKSFLLDPLFWQALGKAMGWIKYMRDDGCGADNPSIEDMPNQGWTETWKHHWHRFIDHLAEGKDAESFFKELLK